MNGHRNGNGNGGGMTSAPGTAAFGVLQERVHGLEQSFRSMESGVNDRFSGISSQIASLAAKLEERAKIPWSAFGVMLTAVTVLGALVYWPIRENQARLIEVVDRLSIRMETNYASSREVELRLNAAGQRRDDMQRATEERIKRSEGDIDMIQKQLVPRGEHEQTWTGQRQRDVDLQRQIDEVRKGFGDLYSPKDALARMQQRIDELERQSRTTGSSGRG